MQGGTNCLNFFNQILIEMVVAYNIDTKHIYNIRPLFALGSVYSTSASGAEQTTETNNSN